MRGSAIVVMRASLCVWKTLLGRTYEYPFTSLFCSMNTLYCIKKYVFLQCAIILKKIENQFFMELERRGNEVDLKLKNKKTGFIFSLVVF